MRRRQRHRASRVVDRVRQQGVGTAAPRHGPWRQLLTRVALADQQAASVAQHVGQPLVGIDRSNGRPRRPRSRRRWPGSNAPSAARPPPPRRPAARRRRSVRPGRTWRRTCVAGDARASSNAGASGVRRLRRQRALQRGRRQRAVGGADLASSAARASAAAGSATAAAPAVRPGCATAARRGAPTPAPGNRAAILTSSVSDSPGSTSSASG